MSGRSQARGNRRGTPSTAAPEVVDPIWLLKAGGVVLLVALLFAYLTLCGLFYRGQWQLVLHPARTSEPLTEVSAAGGQMVRFGAGVTGTPELTGWWIPAERGAPLAHLTLLYLPGADGSLLKEQGELMALHQLGASIFAIDYRGYGQSADRHPDQASMTEDAETAWQYVTGPLHVLPERTIPYGNGVGAALALQVAARHRSSAVVLDQPDFSVVSRVRHDPRSKLVPVELLLRDRFDLRPLLDELTVPKLIISRGDREDRAVLKAADPKMTVTFAQSATGSYVPTLRRFFDQYVSFPPTDSLIPSPAPRAEKQR